MAGVWHPSRVDRRCVALGASVDRRPTDVARLARIANDAAVTLHRRVPGDTGVNTPGGIATRRRIGRSRARIGAPDRITPTSIISSPTERGAAQSRAARARIIDPARRQPYSHDCQERHESIHVHLDPSGAEAIEGESVVPSTLRWLAPTPHYCRGDAICAPHSEEQTRR